MFRATFIGINKYLDVNIRDLAGASSDALVLWALFKDTISDIDDTILINEQATQEAIQQELQNKLGAAQPDDTVLFFFAGHGTQSHQIIPSDTKATDIVATTIKLDDIADLFRSTSARVAICVLDCCFSGAAPARVFEDSPAYRSAVFPLANVEGDGKIFITASRANEPALEHSNGGHGLLTQALLKALETSDSNRVDLIASMSTITEEVRAAASKYGEQQNPVFFGQMEGGLYLPRLTRGSNYYTHFPDAHDIIVSKDIAELEAFSIPKSITDEWASRYSGGLNQLQLDAVNTYRILEEESLLVVAPTSSGKTFIGEMAAAHAITQGKKAVFLLPYRALVNEKFDEFNALYGTQLDMRVIRCTGDYTDDTTLFVRGKYDLAILTFEMFQNLSITNSALLHQIGLVVLDEAQFITEPHRGITVELLLTNLLAARARGITPQFIGLSAVIGDLNHFNSWLDCRTLITYERPIPLKESVIDRSGAIRVMDTAQETEPRTEQLLPRGSIFQRKNNPSSQDIIVPLVQELLNHHSKILIFRNRRGSTSGAANYLANELGLPAAVDTINQLPVLDQSSSSTALRTCLNGGVAFHNSNLKRDEKAVIEKAFRTTDEIRVLVATSTLAAGINTPASVVIIAETEFVGGQPRPYTVAEYKNMAGRAGRLGYETEGLSILLSDHATQQDQIFRKYVLGNLEAIQSSFDPNDLDTWIMRLLSQVNQVPKSEVLHLLANTYGGYLGNLQYPDWRRDMERNVEHLLVKMIDLELIEEEMEAIQLTLLGRACGRSALSFRSAMRLVELLKLLPSGTLAAERLMVIVQALSELDSTYTPLVRGNNPEVSMRHEASVRYGDDIVKSLQRWVESPRAFSARCKRALVLSDWIAGKPLEEIENTYTANPYVPVAYGDITGIANTTRFHLRPAYEITSFVRLADCPSEEEIETLLKQLETGLPAEIIPLLSLPFSLNRGEYLALKDQDITTIEKIKETDPDELRNIIRPDRADYLLANL